MGNIRTKIYESWDGGREGIADVGRILVFK